MKLTFQEIFPPPHDDFLRALNKRDVLVYSCGSLWTSIIPCLALRMLATHIASSKSLKAKVLLRKFFGLLYELTVVNSRNDRETSDYVALDYIDTIANMLRHYDIPPQMQDNPDDVILWETRSFITHVAYLEGGSVQVDERAIRVSLHPYWVTFADDRKDRGLVPIMIPVSVHNTPAGTTPMFSTDTVEWTMDRVVEDLRL